MTPRTQLLKILIGREWLRLRKNPTAIMLMGLLLALALLISISAPPPKSSRPATYWIVYWEEDGLLELLRERLPQHLPVKIVSHDELFVGTNELNYPPGDHAIELRPMATDADGNVHPLIVFRYSGASEQALFPFSQWFWSTTAEYLGDLPRIQVSSRPMKAARGARPLESTSLTDLLTPEMTASLLLFAVQFFICCHLFISFTSQDRERGTLGALALTPAHPIEILYAKYVFHLVLSLTGSAAMIAILKASSLGEPLLWGAIVLTSIGLLSIGTLICAVCRTQSSAGLLMLCYLIGMGVIFVLGTRYSLVGSLRQLMFETHGMSLSYLSLRLGNQMGLMNPLLSLTALVAVWSLISSRLFVARGCRA